MKTGCSILLITMLLAACGGSSSSDTNSSPQPEAPQDEASEDAVTFGSWPRNFIKINEKTFFTADDGVHGRELWVIEENGNIALMADISKGAESSDFVWLRAFGDRLVFLTRNSEKNYYLWALEGNQLSLVKHHQFDRAATNMQDTFLLQNGLIYVFWENGNQVLFSTDGRSTGSTKIGQFPFFRETFLLRQWRNKDYYSQFTLQGNQRLYFEVSVEGAKEIWHTDGNLETTTQTVTDAELGAGASLNHTKFVADEKTLYFSTTETSSIFGDSRSRLDSIWSLDNHENLDKIVADIGVLDSILATESGLLIKAAPAGGIDWENKIYFATPTSYFKLNELGTISYTGYINENYLTNELELLFTTGDQGTGTVHRIKLDTLQHDTLISKGDTICNTGYRIINNNFILKSTLGSHSTCGPSDELYKYIPGSSALTPLLLLQPGISSEAKNSQLIGNYIAVGSKFYYVTSTVSTSEESASTIPESLHVVDSNTQINNTIIDNIYIYNQNFDHVDKAPILWNLDSEIYVSLDDGASGTEPWTINVTSTAILKDINKVPNHN